MTTNCPNCGSSNVVRVGLPIYRGADGKAKHGTDRVATICHACGTISGVVPRQRLP